MNTIWHRFVGILVAAHEHGERDERGLSQSTENAILLAGAAAVAITIVTIVTTLVSNRLGALT